MKAIYASGMRRCGRYESMGNTIVQLRSPFSSGSMAVEENPMATVSAPNKLTQMNAPVAPVQIRLVRRSPAYWRVTIDNPPINVMGPVMVKRFQEVMAALGADEQVRVLVFDSVVDDYFLNHSDLTAKLEDLTGMPEGPTDLPPWPDFLVRLTRLPGCVHCPHPRPCDRQRQRNHAGRRLAMGGGRGDGRRRRRAASTR